jgi:hypothetical protein
MDRPEYFHEFRGQLYDRRRPDWPGKPLRVVYSQGQRNIDNTQQLKAALRHGPYAWPGGYPLFFIANEGEALCFDCVRENLREVLSAITQGTNGGWKIVGVGVNYEDNACFCDHCGEQIESAYGDGR